MISRPIYIILLLITLAAPRQSAAQLSVGDSAAKASAIVYTAKQYQNFIAAAAPVFSGPQYIEYDYQIQKGHPFFLKNEFQPGSISYGHILYESIPMKYDMVQGKIVLKDATGTFRMNPANEKIDCFTIDGHSFIRLVKTTTTPASPPQTGFYEVLYTSPSLLLLKRETKSVKDELRNWAGDAFNYTVSNVDYYIQKDGTYIPVTRKNQVLNYCNSRKASIRQYIRKNNLNFKTDPDQFLLSVIPYYLTLIN